MKNTIIAKYFICMAIFTTMLLVSEKPKLRDLRVNHFSQWGEDGIINMIYSELKTGT